MKIAMAIFGRTPVGKRELNPENPGGYVTIAIGVNKDFPLVQCALAC
jgi:hypothetical protein